MNLELFHPVNFPQTAALDGLSVAGIKGGPKLTSVIDNNGIDLWWALKNTRVVKAWQTARTKAKGVRIALPGAPVTPHAELEGDAILNELALTLSNGAFDQMSQPSVAKSTALASAIVSRQVGKISGPAAAANVLPLSGAYTGEQSDAEVLADAIENAIAHECDIICLPAIPTSNDRLTKAIDQAINNNILVFCAGGDMGEKLADSVRLNGVLYVTGSTAADEVWSGSMTGSHIDFAAPGESVWGAVAGHDTKVEPHDGTEFAAGIAAGIAALWVGHHGRDALVKRAKAEKSNIQTLFRRAVLATSRQPNGWDNANAGCGIIDADALVRLNLDVIMAS